MRVIDLGGSLRGRFWGASSGALRAGLALACAAGSVGAAAQSYSLEQLGLSGDGHTGSDGRSFSQAWSINAAGQVVGTSERYSGNSSNGQSAWIYS